MAAVPAQAKIQPIPDRESAEDLAQAMASDRKMVKRAFFSVVPPVGNPAAVSTTKLADFPRRGKSYAILSSGDAARAGERNRSGSLSGANLGPLLRGTRDAVIMRVDLRVPSNANCLSFRFRFLTDEFPEFVNDLFNDAFIAELGNSNWAAAGPSDPTITAPNNFAVDSQKRPIRVNSVGDTSLTKANAKGTTYDGATKVLRASTEVKPGNRTLYLSIFDQGDRGYDSTVFLDRLTISRNGSCESGVIVD